MYNNKLVASIKANGKILREFKDTVYIPFGQEYSFLLKNLNTKRAIVNIFIDGDNVVPGGLVIDVGREINLERAIRNGNLTEGNKFKFIERTSLIEDGPRGIKLEDGLIRIEYQFELYAPQVFNIHQKWVPGHYEYDKYQFNNVWRGLDQQVYGNLGNSTIGGASGSIDQGLVDTGGQLRRVDMSKNGSAMAQAASTNVSNYCADNGIKNSVEFHDGSATMDWSDSMPKNDVGITVPGSKSSQMFQTITVGTLETEKHTIIFKLLGETGDNKPVLDPVTVTSKTKCTTCGIQSKRNAKFCAHCGTALEIL